LLDAARAKGFKGLVTALGASALTLAAEFKPSAITLDMHLPDMEGWRVLDRIKQDFSVRHIPVCVISTDDSKERAFRSGAMAFIEKPIPSKEVLDRMLDQLHSYVSRPARQVLVALQDTKLACRDHRPAGAWQCAVCDRALAGGPQTRGLPVLNAPSPMTSPCWTGWRARARLAIRVGARPVAGGGLARRA
jgi:CheY-like chemotaxis protein